MNIVTLFWAWFAVAAILACGAIAMVAIDEAKDNFAAKVASYVLIVQFVEVVMIGVVVSDLVMIKHLG
jgi:hypothetical protein